MTKLISASNFEDYWGAGNLTRWDYLTVRSVRMSPTSRAFLTEIGLPSPGRDIHGWLFAWEPDLPQFENNHRKMRLLGSNRGFTPVLIDESRDGCIIWNAAEDQYERFINASVEQFAASLIVLDKHYLRALQAVDEPYDTVSVARELAALEKALDDIDASALADRNSLWSTIVQDIRRELG